MNQTQRILHDLKQGLVVNMLNDIPRYGTSCRNRISELRLSGIDIQDRKIHKSGAKEYFIQKYVDARKEIKIIINDCPIPHKLEDIETIYFNHDENYKFKGADLLKVLEDLKFGYVAIPF